MSPDSADDIADDIELLDVAPPRSVDSDEVVAATPSRWNGLLAVAAIGVVGLVVVGLGANDRPQDATDSTLPPPTTDAPTSTTTTDLDRAVTPIVEIGEGPPISWQPVPFETAATDFRWVDDRFIGYEGDRRIAVVPGFGGPSVSAELVPFDGAPVLSSSSTVYEELSSKIYFLDEFIAGFQWPPQSIDLPPMTEPFSELVIRRVDVAAELLGNDVLVLRIASGTLDVEAFRARTGITLDAIFDIDVDDTSIRVFGAGADERIPLADAGLSDSDLEALRSIGEPTTQLSFGPLGGTAEPVDSGMERIDWIGLAGDEFIVGGTELRRSSNGITWELTSEQTPRFGGLLRPNPDGLLLGLGFDGDEGYASVSVDGGRSWRNIPRPFQNTWRLAAADNILAMTGWADSAFLSAPGDWAVLTADVELRVSTDDETFELLDREGSTLLSGLAGDPSSGFRFAPGSPDVWFVDPASGEEIARVPQRLFASSLAAAQTRDGNPQLVAFTDIELLDPVQEWSMAPIDELFGPTALSVDFEVGDGWLLASVITTDGRELFVAETRS